MAADNRLTAIRQHERGKDPQQRRLPRTIGAEQSEELALAYLAIDIAQRVRDASGGRRADHIDDAATDRVMIGETPDPENRRHVDGSVRRLRGRNRERCHTNTDDTTSRTAGACPCQERICRTTSGRRAKSRAISSSYTGT